MCIVVSVFSFIGYRIYNINKQLIIFKLIYRNCVEFVGFCEKYNMHTTFKDV